MAFLDSIRRIFTPHRMKAWGGLLAGVAATVAVMFSAISYFERGDALSYCTVGKLEVGDGKVQSVLIAFVRNNESLPSSSVLVEARPGKLLIDSNVSYRIIFQDEHKVQVEIERVPAHFTAHLTFSTLLNNVVAQEAVVSSVVSDFGEVARDDSQCSQSIPIGEAIRILGALEKAKVVSATPVGE